MNSLSEMLYRNYIENAHKAKALHNELRELYGSELDNLTLHRKARVDNMITSEEYYLLREYVT